MAKGIMYIDGQRVPFDGEPNVLSVIRKAGIEMPTFCYYSDLSVYGACRMCVVEDGVCEVNEPSGVVLALEDPCWQIQVLPFTHTLSSPGITYTFRHMCCQSHHVAW